jgi:YD repeat-containing protein
LTWNQAGRLIGEVYGNGVSATSSYDAAGRVTGMT